jgi:hypothetical protein
MAWQTVMKTNRHLKIKFSFFISIILSLGDELLFNLLAVAALNL